MKEHLDISKDALYGSNTIMGYRNFPDHYGLMRDFPEFIICLVKIKKACAMTNLEIGALDSEKASAIIASCDEIIEGKYHDQFIISMIEGSGGTSTNMNVNEVIASLANQKLSSESVELVKPNDHVNMSQSTNDVVPTATNLVIRDKLNSSIEILNILLDSFDKKAKEFANMIHLGRTCMQDAQPMYLGDKFSGYTEGLARCIQALKDKADRLINIPLSATAIGTGLGTYDGYKENIIKNIQTVFHDKSIVMTKNLFDGLQNMDEISRISGDIQALANLLLKISNDLMILASGPISGLGEIHLPEVQPGSSIMPGKVNPVIPMMMAQTSFRLNGMHQTVSMATTQGFQELNHYEPIILSELLFGLSLLDASIILFTEKCIDGLSASEQVNKDKVYHSFAMATALVPKLGYIEVSKVVKQSVAENKSFMDLVIEKGLVDKDEALSLINSSIKKNY